MIPAALAAQDSTSSPIQLELTAQKQVQTQDATGQVKTELVAVDKVLPGETIVYTITYRNTGDKPAGNVVVSNPIPAEMTYQAGTATGEGTAITFSIDGGKSYKPANELEVLQSDGSRRPARASEYSAIRWRVQQPVAAGASGSVRYQATLK